MPEVVHGFLQFALRTASSEQSGYQIRKATRGFNVWRLTPRMGWQAIALFNTRDDAEAFVLGLVAIHDN
jgi:hypothetical protein